MFFRDVFAPPNASLPPRLLNRTTVAAMQEFANLTNDWCRTFAHNLSAQSKHNPSTKALKADAITMKQSDICF